MCPGSSRKVPGDQTIWWGGVALRHGKDDFFPDPMQEMGDPLAPGVAPSRQKRFGIVSPAVVGDRPRAEKRAVSIDDGGLHLCGERGVWPVGLALPRSNSTPVWHRSRRR